MLLLQVEHQIEDPDPDRHVQHRDRLVRDDHGGLDSEGARDRDALALPTRQLVRVLRDVVCSRCQTDRLEQLLDALVDVSALDPPVDEQGPHEMVANGLDRVQRAERVLEDHLHLGPVREHVPATAHLRDVLSVEEHLSGRGVVEAREHPRDGALAAAALADEGRHGARPEREADVVSRMHATATTDQSFATGEVLREAPHLECCVCARHSPRSTR